MGGIVLGILVWQEGGEAVGALLLIGAIALAGLAWWLVRRKREGKTALIDAGLFASKMFRLGISGQMVQQISLGGTDDRAADLPADGARVQRDAGGTLDRPTLAQHVRRRGARREASGQAAPRRHHPRRVRAPRGRARGADPDRASGVFRVVAPGPAPDRRIRLGLAGVPAQQLHARPRSPRSVSARPPA